MDMEGIGEGMRWDSFFVVSPGQVCFVYVCQSSFLCQFRSSYFCCCNFSFFPLPHSISLRYPFNTPSHPFPIHSLPLPYPFPIPWYPYPVPSLSHCIPSLSLPFPFLIHSLSHRIPSLSLPYPFTIRFTIPGHWFVYLL